MKATIVMRGRNDMPLIEHTLSGVKRQTAGYRLVAFDNASKDGTREAFVQGGAQVFDVAEGSYIPGQVLNRGMEQADSEIVVFLNADCTPVDEHWLEELLAPFADPKVGAAFSRQMPREDCAPLAAHDIEETYGDGSRQEKWRHCFSMASSAVRRSLWLSVRFSDTLRYSEDMDWSLAIRKLGHEIRYVPGSKVYHSHNYSNEQWKRRQYGEGKAEASFLTWSRWQRSFFRYSLMPMARQILHDARYCLQTRQWAGLLASPPYRIAQMVGRRKGFLDGLREAA